jgi:hypothetical protein
MIYMHPIAFTGTVVKKVMGLSESYVVVCYEVTALIFYYPKLPVFAGIR